MMKLEQICPTVRIKRGLINPSGSIIKIITGNQDNNDAIKYEKLINEIKLEQSKYKNEITLITEMIQTITNSIFQLNDNIIKINLEIRELRYNLSEMVKSISLNHIEIQIIKLHIN